MEEDKDKTVGGESSSRPTSSFVKSGDRQVFTVELRPGETTYVSWKKLMKDANKANSIGSSKTLPESQPVPGPNLESRIVPGQSASNEEKDEPAPNRFSAVIEKIERLYMGKDSSDEEELNDIPDDDQYDTEDSFIDDAELDEYFEVDNSAIKHDGFFVNRGTLERINEPTVIPNQQTKKRRRKDLAKAHGESDDGHVSNKQVKVAKMASGKTAPYVGKNSSTQSLVMMSEHHGDAKPENQMNATGITSKKKSADTKLTLDSTSPKVLNGDTSLSLTVAKDAEKLKTGVFPSKSTSNKLKDAIGTSDASHQKYSVHNVHTQSKSQSGKQLHNITELEPSVRPKEKNGFQELQENSVLESKNAVNTTKTSHIHRKDGSSVRPRSSMLEKAIRELEKMVAESRPPAAENQEVDTSSQAVKRRLPREIKLKLAKVARIAQASQGKISKELLARLMSILGHLIQLRTLKRNLKIGLSAKKETDDRFQHIKKEVVEMIKMRPPSLECKVSEQQAGASDDFQETGSEEKGVLKRKFSMDTVLEDKICDLYDLYVDGLDEDAGPQIRKLYVELAELWPKGHMDNHGIKRAICRAKERRRAPYGRHMDQEKMKKKKMLIPKTEETVRAEASTVAQAQYMRERMAIDSSGHMLAHANKPISNKATARIASPSANGSNLDRMKKEKLKGSSSNSMDNAKMGDGAMTKKKMKRKTESEFDGTYSRPEKLPAQQGEERHKSLKQSAAIPQKSTFDCPKL
ncbi:hypothetical protein Dsin_002452 [Dipteronia sinensis]|uniref:Hpc2-related domain-containing protein n=1 Tax=Dipteronia sinensis TaxID=43782 RepID=A0AAE0EJF2_9ROSI|nr:hypothetical protein Dsin_002452 [Dipteronia sinensis]